MDGKERRQIVGLTYSAHGFGSQAIPYFLDTNSGLKMLSLDLPNMILIA